MTQIVKMEVLKICTLPDQNRFSLHVFSESIILAGTKTLTRLTRLTRSILTIFQILKLKNEFSVFFNEF